MFFKNLRWSASFFCFLLVFSVYSPHIVLFSLVHDRKFDLKFFPLDTQAKFNNTWLSLSCFGINSKLQRLDSRKQGNYYFVIHLVHLHIKLLFCFFILSFFSIKQQKIHFYMAELAKMLNETLSCSVAFNLKKVQQTRSFIV